MGDGDLPSGVGGAQPSARVRRNTRSDNGSSVGRHAATKDGRRGGRCGPRALEKAVLQVPGTIPGQMRSTPAGRRCTNAYTAGPPADHGRPTHYACSTCP